MFTRRGQTLIEMIAVVAVLLLMAAIIVPEYAKSKERSQRRWFFTNLGQAVSYARNQAIMNSAITVLQFDSSSNSFTVSGDSSIDPMMPGQGQSSPDSTGTTPVTDPNAAPQIQNPFTQANQQGMESPQTGNSSSISRTTALPDAYSPDAWLLNGQQVDASTWFVRFYPDGTSDEGMVTFNQGGTDSTVRIDGTGRWSLTDGAAPDPNTIRWQGGSLETRQ